jgi:hypothetical protein
MREKGNTYQIMMGKPEGQGPLGGPGHRWENYVNMDPREVGWSGMDWIDVTQDRDHWKAFMITIKNLWVS